MTLTPKERNGEIASELFILRDRNVELDVVYYPGLDLYLPFDVEQTRLRRPSNFDTVMLELTWMYWMKSLFRLIRFRFVFTPRERDVRLVIVKFYWSETNSKEIELSFVPVP